MGKPENPEAQYRAKKFNLIWHRVSASAAYIASLKEKLLSSFCNGGNNHSGDKNKTSS